MPYDSTMGPPQPDPLTQQLAQRNMQQQSQQDDPYMASLLKLLEEGPQQVAPPSERDRQKQGLALTMMLTGKDRSMGQVGGQLYGQQMAEREQSKKDATDAYGRKLKAAEFGYSTNLDAQRRAEADQRRQEDVAYREEGRQLQRDRELSKEELDANAREAAAAIIDGRGQMPSAASRNRQAQATRAMVYRLEPDFDEAVWKKRVDTEKAFGPASTGQQPGQRLIRANALVGHMGHLRTLGDAMNRGDVRLQNDIKLQVEEQLGYAAPTAFDAIRNLVAKELEAYFVAGGGTGAEREAAAKDFARAQSPEQLEAVLMNMRNAMREQIFALDKSWQAGHGRGNMYQRFMTPSAMAFLQLDPMGNPLEGEGDHGGGAEAPAPTVSWVMGPDGKVVRK